MVNQMIKIPRGCVLWLDLTEDTSNIVYDHSGCGNNGKVYGAVLEKRLPFIGRKFDGVDDYMKIPDSPTIRDWPNGITVICWAKSNTKLWNQDGCLVSKRNSFILHPYKDSRDISFFVYGVTSGWVCAKTTANVYLTQWNMWFGIYDKSKIRVGWNGEIKASEPFTEDIAHDEGCIAIGWDDGSGDRYFNGYIAHVSIYNRALSESEIKYLYEEFQKRVFRRIAPLEIRMR